MIELAGIIILGIVAQWMAWRLKLPAILPLILIGLLVGPIATFYTADGAKLIEPIWNGTKGLFPGDGLYYFVSLAISVILFEGGLTLKRAEIATTGPVISKLITLGSTVTFFGAGIASHFIFELSWPMAFLFSALIIVTGPTVITPILRNIPLKKEVSAILKWEGILIDPIGALVAVLVYEFISVEGGQAFTQTALIAFGKILLFGFSFGFAFAHALVFVIKKRFIPHYLLNVASLSMVLLVFVTSDFFAHESGLLAVVIMGMVMGNINLPNLKELLYFKESLSVLLISILFILLAANINIDQLMLLYDWRTALLFASIILIVRPLGVFLSSSGSGLQLKEKLFIGWVGPRGIVAAGIASLFGSKLVARGEVGAEYITPLVFMIVLGTVLLNATTARIVAKWLGVFLKKSEGILMVGAAPASRLIAQYLQDNDRHVVLIDSNENNINAAKEKGIEALTANIYSDNLADNLELNDVGYLMALTGNAEINDFALNRFTEQFGENGAFRLIHATEKGSKDQQNKQHLFSSTHDYIALEETARLFPQVLELELKDPVHYEKVMQQAATAAHSIPLFLKDTDGDLKIIPSFQSQSEASKEGMRLVYLGKPLIV
jgi:NhaP-type Na+/H+ or K+/H+ antiporter